MLLFRCKRVLSFNTTTPDGYQVDANGAWIDQGVVQTKNVNAGSGQVSAAAAAVSNALKSTVVGGTVNFGVYEQDNDLSNGMEPIEWLVLAKEDTRALVISKYGIDAKPYNTEIKADVTWESCTLRNWLNNDFLNKAFSQEEQARIQNTTVPAGINPKWQSDETATTDKVFILSIGEAKQYFTSDDFRQCKPTAYAKAQGVSFGYPWRHDSFMEIFAKALTNMTGATYENDKTCMWWLRSPGKYLSDTTVVNYDGSVNYDGILSKSARYGVRPALCINLGF